MVAVTAALALVSGALASAARADGDPASDVLATQPLFLPQGTKIEVVSYFDNSSENPRNPHQPPKPVGWGEKTTDEMCIAFVGFVKAKDWQPADAN